MQNNKLEDRVRRYIKMKKFFVLSDALIITGIPKDILLKLLSTLEKEGLIVQDRDNRSIMNKSWTVLSRREKRFLGDKFTIKKIDMEKLKAIKKVALVLEQEVSDCIIYHKLLSQCKLTKGVFASLVNIFLGLNVINEIKKNDIKQNRVFEINRELLKDLLTFYKQKEYKQIDEILNKKRPLRYVAVPKDLVKVLVVIIDNEVLKRDELAVLSGLTRKRLKDWWQVIRRTGLILDSFKESQKQRVSYIFSSKRAKEVLESVRNGAFEKNKELKQLWVK